MPVCRFWFGVEFNGPVNTIQVMLSRSVFLDRLQPISSYPVLVHILLPETDNCPS